MQKQVLSPEKPNACSSPASCIVSVQCPLLGTQTSPLYPCEVHCHVLEGHSSLHSQNQLSRWVAGQFWGADVTAAPSVLQEAPEGEAGDAGLAPLCRLPEMWGAALSLTSHGWGGGIPRLRLLSWLPVEKTGRRKGAATSPSGREQVDESVLSLSLTHKHNLHFSRPPFCLPGQAF